MSITRSRDWVSEFDERSNCVHVMPVDDLQPHTWTADCDCEPELEPIGPAGDYTCDLLIHNAYDKRELN